jgi:hypothetical protein
MYSSTAVEILIASPADVVDARDAIQDEIAQWNTANSRRRGVTAVAVRWETHAVPEMGGHPQAILNRQLGDHCDLLVALFGNRLGTPTPHAPSGTAEEIQRFIANKKPVLLYRIEGRVDVSPDPEQLRELEAFLASVRQTGLISQPTSVEDLRTSFRRHLSGMLADFEPQRRRPPVTLSDFELALLETLGRDGRTEISQFVDTTGAGEERLRFHIRRMEDAHLVEVIRNYAYGDAVVLTQGGRSELFERGLLR